MDAFTRTQLAVIEDIIYLRKVADRIGGHYTPEARSVAFDVDRGILVHRSTDPRAPASSDGFVDIMLSPRVPSNMDEAVNLFPSKEPMIRTGEHVLQNNDSDPTPFLGMSKTDAVEEEMCFVLTNRTW